MELNNNLYTLSTISRSFDKYHVDNNKVHLVSSNFYTNKFELTKDIKFNSVHYIIFIELINLDKFEIIKHNSTCIEFKISLPYFLKYFLGLNSSFESFLEVLIGNPLERTKENRSLLNNVLFVYSNLSWSTIQAVYKNINVDISGGSISKRHILSTAEYNLSSMLLSLGYNLVDIYNSSIILSKQLQISKGKDIVNSELSSIFSYDLEINKVFRLNSLAEYLNLKIEKFKAQISNLELEVKSRQGNFQFSEDSLKKYSRDTPKFLELTKNILNFKAKIEKLKQEISSLNSKVTELNLEVTSLSSLSSSELADKYNKLIFGINKYDDLSNFKNYFKKRKLRGVKDLEIREYSTVSSLRPVNGNGLLSYKSCNLPIKILTPLINFPTRTTEKREFSLYSNNSLVSENIMRLLYLKARKENIQISIEEYLISKKNIIILKFTYRIILFIFIILRIFNILSLLFPFVCFKFLFFFLFYGLYIPYFNYFMICSLEFYLLLVNLYLLNLKSKKKSKGERLIKKKKFFLFLSLNKRVRSVYSLRSLRLVRQVRQVQPVRATIKIKNLAKHIIFILKKIQVLNLRYSSFIIFNILKYMYILNIFLFGLDLLIFLNFSEHFPLYFKNCIKFSFSGIESNTNINIDMNANAANATNTNIFNFNTLSLNEKYEYIKLKFFNKAIEPNLPFLNWFIQLLVNTDGSQNNVDQIIETNLNALQKIEREAHLNSHSFTRIRPFLINKTDTSSTQIPNIVPYKIKNFSNYEE
uniref:RNA polymerase n=1 Tax=Tricholomella constricta TaxID=117010 RepID=A0A386TZ00_9AGAR|nr:RNA polymerase [Tricholomella constricta]AYE93422.1 RNA polymerase [Tricholomella constricta]